MRACVLPALDRGAAVARLRPAERHACDGSTADEMAAGCAVLDLIEHGQPVGAVAVSIVGDAACINAAATRGAATYEALQHLEGALRDIGVRSLSLSTRRPGLVRRMARLGYVGRQVAPGEVFMSKGLI